MNNHTLIIAVAAVVWIGSAAIMHMFVVSRRDAQSRRTRKQETLDKGAPWSRQRLWYVLGSVLYGVGAAVIALLSVPVVCFVALLGISARVLRISLVLAVIAAPFVVIYFVIRAVAS